MRCGHYRGGTAPISELPDPAHFHEVAFEVVQSCALDSRTWLENAIWGLNPNTVIARFSSVACRMRVWSSRGAELSGMNGNHPDL